MHRTNTALRIVRTIFGATVIAAALLLLDHIDAHHQPGSQEYGGYALTALISAIVAGTIGALAIARRTSKRLRSLVERLRLVSAGDYTARADEEGVDEIGELGRAFNSMVETRARALDLLVERANTDSVTGLINHRHFQERLAVEFNRAARYESKLALLMIDIDHFKLYNDMNGHPAGDYALREIASIITEQVRDVDIAARYGGEEFAIVLPETGALDAATLAERIRKAAEERVFEQANPQSCRLRLSIGVAEYPDHCCDRASLLRAADGALYEAKTRGRNMVVTFDGEFGCEPKPDPHKLYVLLHATDLTTVEALAAAIDAKHSYPSGHSVAIASLASEVGEKLGLPEDDRTSLYVASLLRDLGQIAIPNSVLEKLDSLSDSEMKQVQQHPMLGYAIVQKSPYMSAMLPAILYHHERFDGTGYPEGLAGDKIPLSARIIAVVDSYQSMVVARPYRGKLTHERAQSELMRLAGSQFDPEIVTTFLETIARKLGQAA